MPAVPPNPAALAAIRAGVPGLARLSVERVWSELARILAAPDPRAAIALMADLGVLAAVLPEGADRPGSPAWSRLVPRRIRCCGLRRCSTGDAVALAERLRLSAAERDRLAALRAGAVPRPDDDDATLRRSAGRRGDRAADRPRLARPAATRRNGRHCGQRLAAMPRPVFPLEGRDVLALGEPEGPRVGSLLRAVRRWWLDGGCIAETAACRAELVRRIHGAEE